MAYYESKNTVIEAMATYLKEAVAEQGFEPKHLVMQHSEINLGANDLYSRALLYKGVTTKDAPVFANTPCTDFSWVIDKHLEDVFYDLGLDTTQQRVATLANKLRNIPIDRLIDTEILKNARVIKAKFVKIKEWFEEALAIINQMRVNTSLLQTVTEEQKEFSELLDFDWYYDYSDDSSVYRSGLQQHKEAVVKINAALVKNPALSIVVEAVSTARRLGPTFFTKA